MAQESDKSFYALLIGVIVVIVLGTFYVFAGDNSCTTLWVILNLSLGYVALMDDRIRKIYTAIIKGAKNVVYWTYAFLMLFLMVFSSFLHILILPGGYGGASSNASNPFVSNIIFILTLTPIVPLFAYAETILFQRYVISFFLRNYRYRCEHCGGMAIGMHRCDLCGHPHENPVPVGARYGAVIVSALIFAGAHMLLVGSLIAGLTFVGGFILGDLYIREGWMPVAVVHTIYDYLILSIVIGVMLI